jgi:surfeit locus 1 family protein
VPIVRVKVGQRVFAPGWVMTTLTVALCVLFAYLGQWQWRRGVARQAEWDAFARGADRAVTPESGGLARLPRFQRVQLSGQFDGGHQFLLENRVHAGYPGYEVLTPFAPLSGPELLVDRGWVAFTGSRAHLPDIHLATTVAEPVTLIGRVDLLPSAGLALGRAPPAAGPHWPKVTSYPDMNQLIAALGRPLQGRILLLDSHSADGYVRDWQPPGLAPARHFSYAIQWWGFAVTLLVLWAVVSARKQPRASAQPPGAAPDSGNGSGSAP